MHHDTQEVNHQITLQESINAEYKRQKAGVPAATPLPEPIPAPVRIVYQPPEGVVEPTSFPEVELLYPMQQSDARNCFYCSRELNRYIGLQGRLTKLHPQVVSVDGKTVTVCRVCSSWSRGMVESADEIRDYLRAKWEHVAPLSYENFGGR